MSINICVTNSVFASQTKTEFASKARVKMQGLILAV